MNLQRSYLLESAQRFCAAFAAKKDITTFINHFSANHEVAVIEHGDPSLAPFIGKTFTGITGVQKYFEMIGSLLSYDDMSFSDFVVDPDTHKVALKGRARFTWLSTAESWDETFAYMLDFDDENKVIRYQIWADSGSAYLASNGKLAVTRGLVDVNESD